MENKRKRTHRTVFEKWFLNNRFSIILVNILLFFLIIWVFNKISFVLNPAWLFFSAILPPLLLAVIQYYIMNPLVDILEKKLKVPRVLTIVVLFIIVIAILIWIINTLIPIAQGQINALIKNWPHIWNDSTNAVQEALRDPRLHSVKSNLQSMVDNAQKTLFRSGQDAFNTTLGNITSAVNIITMVGMTLLTAPLFYSLC